MDPINRVKITDYLPTKPQVVRAVGYLGEGACEIAALAATYIATIQVAQRAQCMTGFSVNEIPFHAEIVNFDTHPCIPALFTTAAIGLHNLGSKINRCMGNYAQTLANAPSPIKVEDKKKVVFIQEVTSSDDEMIHSISRTLTPVPETQDLDDKVKKEEGLVGLNEETHLFSDHSVSDTEDSNTGNNDRPLQAPSSFSEIA